MAALARYSKFMDVLKVNRTFKWPYSLHSSGIILRKDRKSERRKDDMPLKDGKTRSREDDRPLVKGF